jgi:hypothetical protein|tara:strand:+ start:749 stop:1006 length:258 start_codon:yes stop_codon:yes gene_type:complete
MESKTPKTELVRFTTLINPTILSNIKLISYFTNKKLYEVINQSIDNFVSEFETKNNTSIKSIINLQHKLSNNPNEEVVEKNKDKK